MAIGDEMVAVLDVSPVRSARGLALLCAASYLALSGCVVAIGGHAGHAAAHGLVTCVILWSMISRQRAARMIGDFAPLLLMPLLYAELPRLMVVFGSGFHDATVRGWEARLFGGQPARTLAGAFPSRALSEVLHAGYLAYYPAVFAPALLLYARGERAGFAQTVLALTVTYAVCWTIFALYPVEGPRYAWGAPAGVPDGFVRRLTLALLAGGSSRGAAFPSSHMAISTVQAVMAWRWDKRVAGVLTVVAVLVGLGAVYGGFHYSVDILAGASLGALIGCLVLAAESRASAMEVL